MSAALSIGEFSRLTHLSVKALRHYHDLGLLEPATVDPGSGYRRYRLDQLPRAHLVRRLRDLDMPLDEVRQVVDADDERSRDLTIAQHLARTEEALARTRAVVSSLRELLEAPVRPFDVAHRGVPPVSAVVVSAEVEQPATEAWCASSFAHLAARAAHPAPFPCGALFPAAFFHEGVGRVTAFLPVLEAGEATIPGGDYAVALHRGAYEDLDRTYGALGGYVAEHGIGRDGPIREHYLVGPDEVTRPEELRTELCWPIRSGGPGG